MMLTKTFGVRAILCGGLIFCVLSVSGAAPPIDYPDPLFLDINNDGIDGSIADAVFVSAAVGNDANPGTMPLPKQTITAGISQAFNNGKNQVIVAQGTYSGRVTLQNGIGIFGGYSGPPSWGRSASATTSISTGTVVGGRVTAVDAINLSSTAYIEGFTITTGNAPANQGISNYAVYVNNCPLLAIRYNTIVAGNGGSGMAGSAGLLGASGGTGANGNQGTCDGDLPGAPGGPGGFSFCGRTGGAGGKGGDFGANPGSSGSIGVGGTPGGGGGSGGDPGFAGGTGGTGAPGASVPDGPGGASSSIVGGFWVAASGIAGTSGIPGNGGGGGGGGGGQGCFFCNNGNGNGGGGGGAGGCAGGGGSGGGGGGGSFAVFVVNGGGMIVANNILVSGNGGTGGLGGARGIGGAGGAGGIGGATCTAEVGRGGAGGAGGIGGNGGAGGGGAGGRSTALYVASGLIAESSNTNAFGFGNGGAGGTSQGHAGSASPSSGAIGAFSYLDGLMSSPDNTTFPGMPIAVTAWFSNLPTSVAVNGLPMTQVYPHIYQRVLTTPAALGTLGMTAVPSPGNTVARNIQVDRVLGINGNVPYADLSPANVSIAHFRMWGKIQSINGNYLMMSDGSEHPVRVTADTSLYILPVGSFAEFLGYVYSVSPTETIFVGQKLNAPP